MGTSVTEAGVGLAVGILTVVLRLGSYGDSSVVFRLGLCAVYTFQVRAFQSTISVWSAAGEVTLGAGLPLCW